MWFSEIYDRDLTSVGRIHAQIQRGGGGGGKGGGGGLRTPLPWKTIRNIGFLSNTDQDPLKN